MKKRLISSFVGIAILILILYFHKTYILNAAISLVSGLAAFEILSASKLIKTLKLSVPSIVFAMAIPLMEISKLNIYINLLCFLYIVFLFILNITDSINISLAHIGITFFTIITTSFSLSCIVKIRNNFGEISIYLIAFALICAWCCDIGAFTVGKLFGKHKLAPKVSPNKTVEGSIGGILFVLIASLGGAVLFDKVLSSNMSEVYAVYFFPLIVSSIIAAIIGMIGDLSFSMIKRYYNIKDFGKIMPGHGGVLDRFDSVIFVIPFIYLINSIIPIIK
jgi:CDP-diglyceride synthetase